MRTSRMRRLAGAAFFITVAAGCGRGTEPAGSDDPVRVRAPLAALTPDLVARTGFAPDHGVPEDGGAFGYVDRRALADLPLAMRDLLEPAPEPAITAALREGYHDYAALTRELQSLADRHPDLITLHSAGRSVEGREIWYVVVSDRARSGEHAPKFLYHANMHGDEAVGRELMIYLVRHLADQYGVDPRITQILRNVQLFVMPSMNPDGFERGTRANARGSDLNRNFPDRFSSPRDTPDGRQTEVQHMVRLAHQHHFVYGINWHGGEICFNLPWGNISNARAQDRYGDDAVFKPIGREYTELNRSMYANHRANFDHGLTYGYEWYPVSGGINDWFNWFRGSVHAVVELTVTKWPSSSTLARHWDDNRDAMITYLWRGLRGVHLDVRDAAGAPIAGAKVTVAGSTRAVTYDGPRAHRLTADGPQTVTVEAPGFAPRTLAVEASYLDGDWTTVILDR